MRRECVAVTSLSISHCESLTMLKEDSLTNMDSLETLAVNNNPALLYIHPRLVVVVEEGLYNFKWNYHDAIGITIVF